MAKVVADQRARQGGPGRPVLYVLIGTMVLLVVFVAAFMIWSGSSTPTTTLPTASQQTTQPNASSSNTSAVPTENPAYPVPAVPRASTPGNATPTPR